LVSGFGKFCVKEKHRQWKRDSATGGDMMEGRAGGNQKKSRNIANDEVGYFYFGQD
jgi:hypothetical protein